MHIKWCQNVIPIGTDSREYVSQYQFRGIWGSHLLHIYSFCRIAFFHFVIVPVNDFACGTTSHLLRDGGSGKMVNACSFPSYEYCKSWFPYIQTDNLKTHSLLTISSQRIKALIRVFDRSREGTCLRWSVQSALLFNWWHCFSMQRWVVPRSLAYVVIEQITVLIKNVLFVYTAHGR